MRPEVYSPVPLQQNDKHRGKLSVEVDTEVVFSPHTAAGIFAPILSFKLRHEPGTVLRRYLNI